MRGLREKSGLESDHVTRLQNKQMTEFQANLRALEIEKSTLRQQCDSQARELSTLIESQTQLTRRLHEEEQRAARCELNLIFISIHCSRNSQGSATPFKHRKHLAMCINGILKRLTNN